MKLKSFGCSFIFGTDLADDGRLLPYATGSRLTWPSLVARKLGCRYETYARPGAGNLQILERLLNSIDPDNPAIYVIGWTYIDRFDFIDPDLKTPWPGTKWKTLMPIDDNDVAISYYKNLHSEYADKLKTLIYIKTAIDCLRANGCQFVMTYQDPLVFCRQWHTSKATTDLDEYVRGFLSDFEGLTFLEWSRQHGHEISDTMHPLESAHKAAADLVLSRWQQYLKC